MQLHKSINKTAEGASDPADAAKERPLTRTETMKRESEDGEREEPVVETRLPPAFVSVSTYLFLLPTDATCRRLATSVVVGLH